MSCGASATHPLASERVYKAMSQEQQPPPETYLAMKRQKEDENKRLKETEAEFEAIVKATEEVVLTNDDGEADDDDGDWAVDTSDAAIAQRKQEFMTDSEATTALFGE